MLIHESVAESEERNDPAKAPAYWAGSVRVDMTTPRPRGRPGRRLGRAVAQVSAKMSRSLVSGTNSTPMITVATAMTIGYQRPK